jgi:hypothetical protein
MENCSYGTCHQTIEFSLNGKMILWNSSSNYLRSQHLQRIEIYAYRTYLSIICQSTEPSLVHAFWTNGELFLRNMSSNNRIISEWKDVPIEQFIKLSAVSAITKNGDLRLQNIPLYNLSINRHMIGISILD